MRDILFEISEDSIRGKKTIIDESLVTALDEDETVPAPKTEDLGVDLSANEDDRNDGAAPPAGDTAAQHLS